MSKVKYYYDSETLSYKEVKRSKKTTFYKINRLQNIEIDDLDDFKIVDKMMKFFFKI